MGPDDLVLGLEEKYEFIQNPWGSRGSQVGESRPPPLQLDLVLVS